MKITNGSAFAITWPASVVWENGDVDPVLTASGVDILELVTYDGGTLWYGRILHQKSFVLGGDQQHNGKLSSRMGGSTVINRVAHTIFTAVNKTTTSTVTATLANFNLPAGTLDRNGAGIEVTYEGLIGAGAGGTLVQVLFGGVQAIGATFDLSTPFSIVVRILRRAAGSQRAGGVLIGTIGAVAVATPQLTSLSANEAGIIDVAFQCDQVNAGTFTLTTGTIKYLDPDSTSVA